MWYRRGLEYETMLSDVLQRAAGGGGPDRMAEGWRGREACCLRHPAAVELGQLPG